METAAAHLATVQSALLQQLPAGMPFPEGPMPPPTEALNALVDAFVPVYTVLVACLLVSVHYHQWQLGRRQGPHPSKADAAEEARLWALEKELLAGKRAERARAAAAAAEQERRRREEAAALKAEAHPLSDGVGPGAEVAQRRNFSGVWRSIPAKNVNYDEFLTVQGVPYLKRKIATSTVVVHTIEHEGDVFKLEVQPLNMKTSFNIGGAPTVSYIGKKAFEDKMTWNEKGELVLVKSNAEDGTEITAVRALSEDGRFLVMKQCVRNLKDGKETHAEQTFEKS